ncbi:MAG: hypothetical protein JRE12_19355 [Deltaproteobacteria bacterium]|nr:hypothetical protein [Deltaproteobacteria bacterium]
MDWMPDQARYEGAGKSVATGRAGNLKRELAAGLIPEKARIETSLARIGKIWA